MGVDNFMKKLLTLINEHLLSFVTEYLEDICDKNSEGENRFPFDVACEKIKEDVS